MSRRDDETHADARRRKSAARLYAVQALFQMEASGQPLDTVQREFEDFRFGADMDGVELAEGDVEHFRMLTAGAVTWQARIDQMTDKALVEAWPIARIDPTLRALFRAAGAEMIDAGTPPRVTISEFVEIAKAFFPGGREPKLVNAVLDRLARELRPGTLD